MRAAAISNRQQDVGVSRMASSGPWVMHTPVLSTRHIAVGTLAVVGTKSSSVVAAQYRGGAFVYLGATDSIQDLPQDLVAVATWLRREYPGEAWVRFDADGIEFRELPLHEWCD